MRVISMVNKIYEEEETWHFRHLLRFSSTMEKYEEINKQQLKVTVDVAGEFYRYAVDEF
ncbi:hypothetical protein H5410_058290 [Solanum commersonii]|uniref:Uncharacterized protein n=1 Tax=Solanum commersonii TaxID=4109 RepID=A0A9J5WSP4_SOLCO|nr:hypothetical protein H5410_058290 [Solanum commersonii]